MEDYLKRNKLETEGCYYEMALLAQTDKLKKYVRKIELN